MKAFAASFIATWMLLTAGTALAQQPAASSSEPVKLGLILDMSSVYSDVTGAGSETAAKMAVEDFGGKVLGRPIEVLAADHQNKADVAAAIARKWFDVDHVTALMDVAASSPALAVITVAKERDKVVILNGPGATASPTRRASRQRCTTPTPRTPWPTRQARRWCSRAASPGSS